MKPNKEETSIAGAKTEFTSHEVSRVTCIINQQSGDEILAFLKLIQVDSYIENGRTIREHLKPRPFGLPGTTIKLQCSVASVFRFTVPREYAQKVMDAIASISELHIPGRGTIFSQDLLEYSQEVPGLNTQKLEELSTNTKHHVFLCNLSYVMCVLSTPGSGEMLSKTALELGICVPLITFGSGNDLRDQLGLIRITISPEKEVVHLVIPNQDSDSIIRLLVEDSKLDRPDKGYIFQTPVSMGLIDTRLKIGKQNYAASIDQIIAAIDTLKMGTNWRKRLDMEAQESISKAYLPASNCEVSIITEEDRVDELREICLEVGASGAVTSRVSLVVCGKDEENEYGNLIRSEISIPEDLAENVLHALLGITPFHENGMNKIQILNTSNT